MYVRGPGIEHGGIIDAVTTHTDISSTLLQIAGVTKQLDGIPMPLDAANGKVRREHASVEYWGAVRIFLLNPIK